MRNLMIPSCLLTCERTVTEAVTMDWIWSNHQEHKSMQNGFYEGVNAWNINRP